MTHEQPQAIEMEKFVLGSMLLKDGEVIPAVTAILSADDFYRPEHRLLYQAILDIRKEGQIVNIIVFMEHLRLTSDTNGKSLLDSIGLEHVLSIIESANTTAYSEHYTKQIKEKSDLRKLQEVALKITADAETGLKSPLDIVNDAISDFKFLDKVATSKITSLNDYFNKKYEADIDNQLQYYLRKTGFSNIDENQIFSSGLYVLGAMPACGKTTFAWQLAEQLARNGEYCIFCSYEMSTLELSTKTVARELFKNDPKTTLSSAEIRRGGYSHGVLSVIKDYLSGKFNLNIIEVQNETIDELLNLLRPICTNSEKAPIVFIDYLQIIPSNEADSKRGIDDIVRKLKVFQRETDTTFIVISSFNRTNYLSTVSFESFKESGNIEYTADVVWALQLNIVNSFKNGISVTDSRKQVDAAKKQQPRQIQLKCLKNRQGNNYDCFFNYYSAHDFFEPVEKFDNPEQARNNPNYEN